MRESRTRDASDILFGKMEIGSLTLDLGQWLNVWRHVVKRTFPVLGISHFDRLSRQLLFALGLGVLFWLVEALIMVYFFQMGDLTSQILTPSPNELWLRLLVSSFFVGFAFHANSLLNRREKIEKELRESEQRYRQLVELFPDAVIVQSVDKIVYINTAGVELFGAKYPEEFIGKSIWDFVYSEEFVVDRFRKMGFNSSMASFIDQKVTRLDGRQIFTEVAAVPMTYRGMPAFQAIFRDITERRQAFNEIDQRNRELAALNAISAMVNQAVDLDKILQNTLDAVLRLNIFGEESSGMLFLLDEQKQTLRLASHRGTPKGHPCLVNTPRIGECLCGQAILRDEIIVSQDSWSDERHTRRYAEMDHHKDICIPLKARGKTLGVMEIRLPIKYEIIESDLKLLKAVADQIGVAIENASLRENREQVIVQERERIARELHDGLSQVLGYVNTKAMGIRLMVRNRQLKEALENLIQLEEASRELLIDVRAAILGLRMAGHIERGLDANLTEFAAQFSRMSGIPVDISISPDMKELRLGMNVELQLTRIVQEALFNVRKHASASHIEVKLSKVQDCLELSIIDDGIGFDKTVHQKDNVPGFGLATMQERAELIHAEFDLVSEPGHGTVVTVRLPLQAG